MKPLAIDLFCGLGGWTEGLLATGWNVIGFDIELHVYGEKRYPAQLVIQDVLTLHGSQFKDADLIVASPPCTEYSYMAMPWTRAKQIRAALKGEGEFPEPYTGSRTVADLNALFDACFRIQREASESAGRHIPLIVENVRGAQEWVGPAKYNYGSFYLWGDIPALMPRTPTKRMKYQASAAPRMWKDREVPRLNDRAYKSEGLNWSDRSKRGQDFTRVAGQQCGTKQAGLSNEAWFDHGAAAFSSRSTARKQASAEIAKIPAPLAKWVGEVMKPVDRQERTA